MLRFRFAFSCMAVLVACAGGADAADRTGSRFNASTVDKAPLPAELGNQATNVFAGARLVFYGIRHEYEDDAVTAVENGKFFCSCTSLSR